MPAMMRTMVDMNSTSITPQKGTRQLEWNPEVPNMEYISLYSIIWLKWQSYSRYAYKGHLPVIISWNASLLITNALEGKEKQF